MALSPEEAELLISKSFLISRGSNGKKVVEKKITDYRVDSEAPLGKFIDIVCAKHPVNTWRTKNFGGSYGEELFLDRKKILVAGEECNCDKSELRLARTHQVKREAF